MPIARRNNLSQSRLKEVLLYIPESGLFYRKNSERVAGTTNIYGYRYVTVDSVLYYGHRLAWLYMTGEWPPDEVDHINRIRDDNRWDNLRSASRRENRGNMLSKRNTSGVKGVYWNKEKGLWQAQIASGATCRYLGRFVSIEEAKTAYDTAAREYFGDFTTQIQEV